jgi:hypothetical protein
MSDVEKFLLELLRWNGIASSRDIGPVIDRAEDRARQRAKRRGLVTYEGGYWRLTDKGRELMLSRGHVEDADE